LFSFSDLFRTIKSFCKASLFHFLVIMVQIIQMKFPNFPLDMASNSSKEDILINNYNTFILEGKIFS
jgi:hypothetical protein